jgi:hypothetical protein
MEGRVEFGSSFRGILVSRHVENLMVGRRIRRSATERSGAIGQSTNAFAELSEVGPAFERRPWTNSLSGRNNEKYCKTSAWRNRSPKS